MKTHSQVDLENYLGAKFYKLKMKICNCLMFSMYILVALKVPRAWYMVDSVVYSTCLEFPCSKSR